MMDLGVTAWRHLRPRGFNSLRPHQTMLLNLGQDGTIPELPDLRHLGPA